MTSTTFDDEWIADALETVEEMRANRGDLDLTFPNVLLPSNQRYLRRDVDDMREFGFVLQVKHDAMGRIVSVWLLEQ